MTRLTKIVCSLQLLGTGAMVYFYFSPNQPGYTIASLVAGTALMYLISTAEVFS